MSLFMGLLTALLYSLWWVFVIILGLAAPIWFPVLLLYLGVCWTVNVIREVW